MPSGGRRVEVRMTDRQIEQRPPLRTSPLVHPSAPRPDHDHDSPVSGPVSGNGASTHEVVRERSATGDRLKNWLLEGHTQDSEGPHAKEREHRTHSWWRVMCLTGVDYF